MIGFCGTVTHQLDEKFRVRIPSKYFPKAEDGSELEDKSGVKLLFMMGPGCISVYTESALNNRCERLMNVDRTNFDAVSAERVIRSSIEELETDKQGRVVLPASLRTFAKIEKDLVSVGMGDHFEIWAKKEYERALLNMSYERASTIVGFF